MTGATRRLPLRGADLVLLAMHAPGRGPGRSNNTIMVVECDGPLAPERLRQALDRFLDVCPWPASRLRRAWPWGKLHWAAGARATLTPPPVRRRTVAAPAELQHLLESELDAAIDPRREPPLRLLVVDVGPEPAAAAGILVVTWFHPLMDPRGGQNLLAHLAQLDAHDGRDPWRGRPPVFVAGRDPRPLRERGRLARRSLAYMQALAPRPPVSPGTGLAAPGPHRFLCASFVEAAGSQESVTRSREITWRLAVVGRAMTDLWRRRGLPEVPFLLPISVDLRPRGEPGATFGNQLAFHFARFEPAQTADVPALARALRAQMADAVRDGQVEANAVAMEFLHLRRVSTMLGALPWAAGGETFSFNCADIGEFPRLGGLLGRRVVRAYHVPAVLPRPGLGVFFNRCAGRDNVVVSWVEGAVKEAEATRILELVGEGMGWTRAA